MAAKTTFNASYLVHTPQQGPWPATWESVPVGRVTYLERGASRGRGGGGGVFERGLPPKPAIMCTTEELQARAAAMEAHLRWAREANAVSNLASFLGGLVGDGLDDKGRRDLTAAARHRPIGVDRMCDLFDRNGGAPALVATALFGGLLTARAADLALAWLTGNSTLKDLMQLSRRGKLYVSDRAREAFKNVQGDLVRPAEVAVTRSKSWVNRELLAAIRDKARAAPIGKEQLVKLLAPLEVYNGRGFLCADDTGAVLLAYREGLIALEAERLALTIAIGGGHKHVGNHLSEMVAMAKRGEDTAQIMLLKAAIERSR